MLSADGELEDFGCVGGSGSEVVGAAFGVVEFVGLFDAVESGFTGVFAVGCVDRGQGALESGAHVGWSDGGVCGVAKIWSER